MSYQRCGTEAKKPKHAWALYFCNEGISAASGFVNSPAHDPYIGIYPSAYPALSCDTFSANSTIDSAAIFHYLWHGKLAVVPNLMKNFGIYATKNEKIRLMLRLHASRNRYR